MRISDWSSDVCSSDLAPLGADTEHGSFFAPRAYEIDAIAQLQREVFGPILHIVRFDGDRIDDIVDAINGTGYGLTLGIHSRVDATVRRVAQRARVGNIYVKIGRAHVCTPVTNAHLVCRLLLEKKQNTI